MTKFISFLVVVAVLGFMGCGNKPVSIKIEDSTRIGLIAYYPFNGNANDASGNGHNGVPSGATLTSDRFGSTNAAYGFDGINSEIDLGKLPAIDTFSISLWFKKAVRSGYPSEGEADLFGTQNTCNICFKFGFHTGFKDQIYFSFSDTGCTPNNDRWLGSSSQIQDTAWHNAVVIRKGISVSLILDNVPQSLTMQGSLGAPSGLITTNSVTKLGTVGGVTDSTFSGKIDDVRIYGRALPDSVISVLYHEGGWQ